MEKELKILTANVTIQLITVDGKRMTKAVFEQIQTESPFNENFEFTGKSYLGYVVNSKGTKVLLWVTHSGDLRKIGLIEHNVIKDLMLNKPVDSYYFHFKRNGILLINLSKYLLFNESVYFVSKSNHDNVMHKLTNIDRFLTNLKDQLYIAV